MKTVCESNMCSGCMACIEKCSKDAISIVDSIQAYNAVIDEKKCINCGVCKMVCPNKTQIKKIKPIEWYQGWAREKIRSRSSSGGAASAIIRLFIKNGGFVASCLFKDGEFVFEITNSIEEAKKFAGSRYVKSNPIGIYKKINEKLCVGEKVLFIGLPCQIAAAKKITKNPDNLYTIDLICHGSPSPKILEKFLKEYGSDIKQLKDVQFRTKNKYGLKQNDNKITFERTVDNYLLTFLKCISYTENCYSCKYATFERISDITLGDSWGTNLKSQEDKGISLILIQTEKGKVLVDNAELELKEIDIENAIENNHQLRKPSTMHPGRKRFLSMIKRRYSFKLATLMVLPKDVIKNDIKTVLIKMHIIKGVPRDEAKCSISKD